MDLPFGAWQPDRGDTGAPLLVADGVLPTIDGWGPHPALYVPPGATALPGAPRGIISVVLNNNAWEAFGFTVSAFYQLQSDYTWSAAIASGYACPVGYDWSALHFGTKLLFTNTFDGLHSYDVETPGAVTYISGAGDPAYIFTCANFIVAVNCKDSLGNRDIRLIKTSGFNDQTNWTTDGADYQELADGEALLCGFDLKNNTALLVQQRAFVLMQFGNAPGGAQFSLQKVADGKGSVGARSCVGFDGMVFGLATDGFFRFDLSSGLTFIGDQEIDQTFLADVDQSNFTLVQGAIDPLHRVVTWRYKRNIDSSTTVSEVCIGYNWQIKRWFTVTEQTSALTRLATVAVSYDAATGTYDSQTLTYDDLFWTGSAPLFGGLDENYKFGLWTGASLLATLTTGIINSGNSGKLLWATPITDSALVTLDHGVTDDLAVAITFEGPATKTESGRIPSEARGMNDQFRMIIAAGDTWSYANGIDHLVRSTEGPK
jgi:hypothetical protein